jgi:ABC-type spermidine/putrescine transport system permease subunit I
MDSVVENLKVMRVRNCRQKSQDLNQWRAIVQEAKAHDGLQRPAAAAAAAAVVVVVVVVVVVSSSRRRRRRRRRRCR